MKVDVFPVILFLTYALSLSSVSPPPSESRRPCLSVQYPPSFLKGYGLERRKSRHINDFDEGVCASLLFFVKSRVNASMRQNVIH
jgi:hypothetical protein